MGTLGTGTVGTWGHLKTPGSVLGTGTHLGFRGQEGTLWGQEGTPWARGTPGPWGLSWGQKRDTLGPWGHCGDAVGSVPSRSGRRPGLVLPHPVQHLLSGHHAEPLRGEVRRGGAGPPPPPGAAGCGAVVMGPCPSAVSPCPRRQRPALGECLARLAAAMPVAFLEPRLNEFNPCSVYSTKSPRERASECPPAQKASDPHPDPGTPTQPQPPTLTPRVDPTTARLQDPIFVLKFGAPPLTRRDPKTLPPPNFGASLHPEDPKAGPATGYP